MMAIMNAMEKLQLSVDDIDALTGRLLAGLNQPPSALPMWWALIL